MGCCVANIVVCLLLHTYCVDCCVYYSLLLHVVLGSFRSAMVNDRCIIFCYTWLEVEIWSIRVGNFRGDSVG